jgi:peptidoglycan/xylan/chitin deacetylase (PgdA/CDA1 family)
MTSRFYFISALVVFFAAIGLVVVRHDDAKKSPEAIPVKQVPLPATQIQPRTVTSAPPSYTHIATGVQTHILMYHYIRTVDAKKDPLGFRLSVTSAEFEAQLVSLSREGYQSLTMDQVAAGIGGAKTVALTFDDGYEDFYTTAWPLLKKYGFTATIYIISGKIDGNYMTWDQIRELQKAGIQIGAHTVDHVDLSKATPASQAFQIDTSKQTIEEQIGVPVNAFCYPSGKFNPLTIQLTRTARYSNATTTEPGSVHVGDDPFTLHRVRINPGMIGEVFLKAIRG